MYARLYAQGTTKDLLPYQEHARIMRVRRGLLVAGNEVMPTPASQRGNVTGRRGFAPCNRYGRRSGRHRPEILLRAGSTWQMTTPSSEGETQGRGAAGAVKR